MSFTEYVQSKGQPAHVILLNSISMIRIMPMSGNGCGSVGRAVASNTWGLQFESSHWQKFICLLNICLLSTVYWKDENKEKEAGNGPLKKLFQSWIHTNIFLWRFLILKHNAAKNAFVNGPLRLRFRVNVLIKYTNIFLA